MTITTRQFDQLSEMGVSLWQSRTSQNTTENNEQAYLPQDQQSLTQLTKQQVFSDILLSLGLSVGEVKVQNNHLDLGLFNWYFLKQASCQVNVANEQPLISYLENKLISPNIDAITQSVTLKKQLWQILAEQLI